MKLVKWSVLLLAFAWLEFFLLTHTIHAQFDTLRSWRNGDAIVTKGNGNVVIGVTAAPLNLKVGTVLRPATGQNGVFTPPTATASPTPTATPSPSPTPT